MVVLGLPLVAVATDWYEPTLEEYARDSARIARVRILGVEEVVSDDEGEPTVCGYRYRVKVTEALKGSADDFEFLGNMRTRSDSADHLVLAFELEEHQRADFRQRASRLPSEQRVVALCRLGPRLRYHEYLLMEFDAAASEDLGGEWLRSLEAVTAIAELDRVQTGDPAYEVLQWDAVRRVILGNVGPSE